MDAAGGGAHLRDVQLKLPDEPVFEIASIPDGALFVSTFGGNVYRRRAGGGDWRRVMHIPPPRTSTSRRCWRCTRSRNAASSPWRAHASTCWREGQPPRLDYRPAAADSVHCGDFVARRAVTAAWGTEVDTYAVGGQPAVMHYRGGAWRLEPVGAEPADLCGMPPVSALVAVAVAGGGDGWVYAGRDPIVRVDGRWQIVNVLWEVKPRG